MIRLFTDLDLHEQTPISLSAEQGHYLLHVMRLSVGDKITLFNGRDGEWAAELIELSKKSVRVIPVEQTRKQTNEPGGILYMALIKKDPLDMVVQKATELGVSEIHFIQTDRTVVGKINIKRLTQIATEAAEQSERLSVPKLFDVCPLKQALSTVRQTPVYLSERGKSVGALNRKNIYAFFVGPEGGWSPAEIAFFEQSKAQSVHLGRLILRAETACCAILACQAFDIFD